LIISVLAGVLFSAGWYIKPEKTISNSTQERCISSTELMGCNYVASTIHRALENCEIQLYNCEESLEECETRP
jgi:hypothetical protein